MTEKIEVLTALRSLVGMLSREPWFKSIQRGSYKDKDCIIINLKGEPSPKDLAIFSDGWMGYSIVLLGPGFRYVYEYTLRPMIAELCRYRHAMVQQESA